MTDRGNIFWHPVIYRHKFILCNKLYTFFEALWSNNYGLLYESYDGWHKYEKCNYENFYTIV